MFLKLSYLDFVSIFPWKSYKAHVPFFPHFFFPSTAEKEPANKHPQGTPSLRQKAPKKVLHLPPKKASISPQKKIRKKMSRLLVFRVIKMPRYFLVDTKKSGAKYVARARKKNLHSEKNSSHFLRGLYFLGEKIAG